MSTIADALAQLFSADGFVPRRICGRWPDWLVAEHVVGHAMIWLAYVTLPILIWRLARRRYELRLFRGLALSLAFFVGLCGLGHFLDMVAFFRPMYRLSGHVLIATGLVSWWTAWAMLRAWPAIMAMKSPEELERRIAERTEELTRAIAELRRSEIDRAYLATIVESSNDAIIGKDLDGVVTSWNAGAERLFGHSAAEAIGRPVTFLVPPDHLDAEPSILAKLRAGEPVEPVETVRMTRDGRRIDVSLSLSPIRDGSGQVVGVSKIARDIGARKAAEEALRRRELEYETLAENCPLIIARFDLHHRHLYVNRSVEHVSGLRREHFLGKTNGELGMPADLCALWEAKQRTAMETRRLIEFEFSSESRHGRRDLHARVVPEFGPDGSVVSILGVSVDVTERRALQAELLSIAEQQQRRIGQDLHDDVGQELTGVGLMSEALADELREEGAPEAALMARICERLDYVRERIHGLARGLLPFEVDARGLMSVLEELINRVGSQNRIEATFECEAAVSIRDNHVSTQLYRIAQEAIANAIKHGKPRHIHVRLGIEDGRIILEIRDDGVGMAADCRFGEGMGLKIMQYRAELIGATLDIDPVKPTGTRVACGIRGGS